MPWIVGVDGGGSKTKILAKDANTNRLICAAAPSICPVDHGIEGFCGTLISALRDMCIYPSDVISICLGIPCYGEFPELDEKLRSTADTLFPNAKTLCENDGYVGFAGAFGLEAGINVVSGTGAIVYGVDESGNSARSNGWHSEFSDEGSGTWLGREAFSVFAKQADGRCKRTALYDIFKRRLGLQNDLEIIEFYNSHCNSRRELASYQRLLLDAARTGDNVAIQLYGRAAHELVESVAAVYRRLKFATPVRVSYSGGCFQADNFLLKPFSEELANNIKGCIIQKPMYTPEHGALLAAERLR